ncbi:MAG: hypothetical protein KKE73_12615 [Proteobacteria bacterium]|nr:hypothetical protein [Pseudomonadota bacterium]
MIEIKETGEEVYLCDECDSTWIRTDDILNEKKVMSFDAYVLFKKLDGIIDYNNSIILKGYMLYGNIENVAARYGVKVVGPMECE